VVELVENQGVVKSVTSSEETSPLHFFSVVVEKRTPFKNGTGLLDNPLLDAILSRKQQEKNGKVLFALQ